MTKEERQKIIVALDRATTTLCEKINISLLPADGTNLVYALSGAADPSEVAGIPGGITCRDHLPASGGSATFGAGGEVASIVLTAIHYEPVIQSAGIIRYSEEIASICEDLFSEVKSFDRNREPPGTPSMDWGVAFCCQPGDVPDVICDRGTATKEPLIRLLGEDPKEIVQNLLIISKRI